MVFELDGVERGHDVLVLDEEALKALNSIAAMAICPEAGDDETRKEAGWLAGLSFALAELVKVTADDHA